MGVWEAAHEAHALQQSCKPTLSPSFHLRQLFHCLYFGSGSCGFLQHPIALNLFITSENLFAPPLFNVAWSGVVHGVPQGVLPGDTCNAASSSNSGWQ